MRPTRCYCLLCTALAAALAFALFFGAPTSASAAPVSFVNEIAPLLKDNCFGCHGAKNPKGKLDMTRYETLRKGGTHDDPIVPGKPDESYIVEVLKATNASRMPPKDTGDALAKEKITLIERWVAEGAKLDGGLTAKSDLVRELRLRWKPSPPPASYTFPATVTALAFTPDGKQLVVSGHHELTVWDIESGKLVKRVYTRARRAMAMVFLPDGKLVVAGGRPGEEGDVRVYDLAAAGKTIDGVTVLDGVNDKAVLLKQLLDADDEVQCLALSADGKKLASGGCDRVVNVWDLSSGVANAKLELTFENHADWVNAVVFATDGKHLVTGSRDKTAKVYDLATKESVLTFPDHQNPVTGVAIKADGKVGYSVGDDNQLRSWNAVGDNAGKPVRGGQGGHGKPILRMIAVPTKAVLATASADMSVKLWNADNASNLKTLSGHTDWVQALAGSTDGTRVASGAWNGEVKVWKVPEGTLVKEFNASPGLKAPKK